MSTKVTAATLARDALQFLAFKRAMGMGYREVLGQLDRHGSPSKGLGITSGDLRERNQDLH